MAPPSPSDLRLRPNLDHPLREYQGSLQMLWVDCWRSDRDDDDVFLLVLQVVLLTLRARRRPRVVAGTRSNNLKVFSVICSVSVAVQIWCQNPSTGLIKGDTALFMFYSICGPRGVHRRDLEVFSRSF